MKFDREKMEQYLEKLAETEKQKNLMIKSNIDNPSEFRKLLSKFTDSGIDWIDSDSYLYLDEDLIISSEEFYEIFETISWYLNSTNRMYDASEMFPEDNYFPTKTGHLMFDGKIITVEEVYGQGTLLTLSIDSIELAENTDIPMSSIGDFERNAKIEFKNSIGVFDLKESKETAKLAAIENANMKAMQNKLKGMS